MKIAFATLVLVLSFSSLIAQQPECDCTIVPFKPPKCVDRCCTRILITSTVDELELILGLQKETARRIAEWKERNEARTLKDFEKVLEPEEIEMVSKEIDSLNKLQLQYLTRSPEERMPVTTTMKTMIDKMDRERP